MSREILLFAPGCPILLAERWIRDRYREVCRKWLWSFKVAEGEFSTPAVYNTGTITVTNNSTAIVGAGTTFTSAMANRQLQVGGFTFNINTFTDTTNLVIDRKWQSATAAAQTYSIVQGWITPAETDFQSFLSVVDPSNSWRIRLHFNYRDLDRIDPRRASSGVPTLLSARSYNSSGVPRFELWPYSTSIRQYTFLYEKAVADLSATSDSPAAPVSGDALVWGAVADLCRWPGTETYKNPMFTPQNYFALAREYEAKFVDRVDQLNKIDQNIYLTDLLQYQEIPWAPLDSKFIQNHAFA